jgi:hypothetical protein
MFSFHQSSLRICLGESSKITRALGGVQWSTARFFGSGLSIMAGAALASGLPILAMRCSSATGSLDRRPISTIVDADQLSRPQKSGHQCRFRARHCRWAIAREILVGGRDTLCMTGGEAHVRSAIQQLIFATGCCFCRMRSARARTRHMVHRSSFLATDFLPTRIVTTDEFLSVA